MANPNPGTQARFTGVLSLLSITRLFEHSGKIVLSTPSQKKIQSIIATTPR